MRRLQTLEQIRHDIEQLRLRSSYRTMVMAARVFPLAMLAFILGFLLQNTFVPETIVALIIVASFVVCFGGGLVYTATALFIAGMQMVKARSIFDPVAQREFAKAFLADLFRPIIRRKQSRHEPKERR